MVRLKRFGIYSAIIGLLMALAVNVLAAPKKGVTRGTYQIIQESNKASEQGQFDEAIKKLQAWLKKVDGLPYDTAMLQQHLAFAYLKIDNAKAAYENAESALQSEELPDAANHNLRWLMAQLAYMLEDYRDSIVQAKHWLKEAQPNKNVGQAHFLIGYSYYQLSDFQAATAHLEQAVQLKNPVPLDWQRLLLATYLETKHFQKAEKVLQQLIVLQPQSAMWWQYLVGVYLEQEKYDQALATLVAADHDQSVQDRYFMQMVQLYDHRGIPVKAAKRLQQAIEEGRLAKTHKHYKLLAHFWFNAREFEQAKVALSKAATLSETGQEDLLLARLYIDDYDWKQAVPLLQKAIRKGGLKSPGRAQLMLGVSAYHTQQKELARRALLKAQKTPNLQKEANYWLAQLSL